MLKSIMDALFTPKWKSDDPEKRTKAIQKLKDNSILRNLAIHDLDKKVRIAAINKLENEDDIIFVLENVQSERIGGKFGYDFKKIAFSKISNQEGFWRILHNASDTSIQSWALGSITDFKALGSFLEQIKDENSDLVPEIIDRIPKTEVRILSSIFSKARTTKARFDAAIKINDKSRIKTLLRQKIITFNSHKAEYLMAIKGLAEFDLEELGIGNTTVFFTQKKGHEFSHPGQVYADPYFYYQTKCGSCKQLRSFKENFAYQNSEDVLADLKKGDRIICHNCSSVFTNFVKRNWFR